MNKVRRKQLADAMELIEQVQAIITEVAEEEREAFENLPEGLQASERGEKMEETADFLEEIVEALDSCYCDTAAVVEGEV